MADDLAAVVRNLAQEEGIAAELDRPYTPAMRDRYVRDVRRRRTAGVSALAIAAVVVVGAGAWGAGRVTSDLPPVEVVVTEPTPTPTPEPTATRLPPSETPTATPAETSTPTETPSTPPAAPEPEEEETTPPPPPPAPPGAVSGLRAEPGGGSGEIAVWWEPADGATGYTVYRADAVDGSYTAAASIDVTTGAVTIRYGGVYEFIQMVQGIQSATAIEYYEAIGTTGFFRVAGYNAGGEGPWSGVVCALPPGSPEPAPVC